MVHAYSRVILALAVPLVVLLETQHPLPTGRAVFVVLAAYAVWAVGLAATAWRSWWWDFRLAPVFHAIDIAVFIVTVGLTEAGSSYFTSPFIGFTAYLLIAAMARWGRRGVGLTALALAVSYVVIGSLLFSIHEAIDTYKFGRRLLNMGALSLMMLWFGAEVRTPRLPPLPDPGGIAGKRREALLNGLLAFSRTTFNARGVAIAVNRSEEPWVYFCSDIDGVVTLERCGPSALSEDFDPNADAALFDISQNRRIISLGDLPLAAVRGPFSHALADKCNVSQGLMARIASASTSGQVLVWGFHPDIDDLPLIALLAREIGLSFDREVMAMMAQETAVAGVRNSLARDLHDSVAQLLVGTLFRLEGLRRSIRRGHDPDGEIVALKDVFRSEQDQLRAMIDNLRRGVEADRTTDLVGEFETVAAELSRNWQIATKVDCAVKSLPLPIDLVHELRQIAREAVANAVRHGQADQVNLVLAHATRDLLQISISDNGKGFTENAGMTQPRSIRERVQALGGHLNIFSCGSGARLDIELPLQIATDRSHDRRTDRLDWHLGEGNEHERD